MLLNEVKNLRDLDHPNILKMYEFFEDSKRFFLITDKYEGGELFDEIVKKGRLSERNTATIIYQLLSCINYLHQKNIVHRDVKPENIMLEKNKQFDQIKIIDFGTSIICREG